MLEVDYTHEVLKQCPGLAAAVSQESCFQDGEPRSQDWSSGECDTTKCEGNSPGKVWLGAYSGYEDENKAHGGNNM